MRFPITHRRSLTALLGAALAVLSLAAPADALVRLENLCTVQGQQEVRLTGMGLVVGLQGTGDGAKSAPTIRAMRAALTRMNSPVLETELKNADSVAIVMIEATIPRTGLRRGQKIDCFVSAVGGAKSLRGGRLLSAPLTSVAVGNDLLIALAGGGIIIEDISRSATGKIIQGCDLQQDTSSLFVKQQGPMVTLLIDPHHASFWTASEVARVINTEYSFELGGQEVAKPINPGVVEVAIPPKYRDSPVDFVAQVLDIHIEMPTTLARVIINSRTGTVIVTGEVEISPVIIAHKSFSIEIGPEDQFGGTAPGPFRDLTKGQGRQSPEQLKQLIEALNQLRVPAPDIISIIRELHATGKLHAELVDR
ncbi:MAG: flagellar basal body P-ring protein FlgI [Planctomycetaceae bacterium]|nr:flagellar basal body P-ring protein FlgI [Planctomycetaceae bacterium]